MRVELSRRLRVPALFSLIFLLGVPFTVAAQQTRVTVVVLSARPVQPGLWDALAEALLRDLDAASGSRQSIQLLRAADVQPGIQVDRLVTLTLHGDCTLVAHSPTAVTGALGWVRRVHGEIEPFIHVDCDRIGRMLGPRALTLDRPGRDAAMAAAIARVVEHEWLHIASQSTAHAEHGVMQRAFSAVDLLSDTGENPQRGAISAAQGR